MKPKTRRELSREIHYQLIYEDWNLDLDIIDDIYMPVIRNMKKRELEILLDIVTKIRLKGD